MKKLLVVLFMVTTVVSLSSCKESKQTEGNIQVVSPEEMKGLLELDEVQLVDVRTPEEYAEGYIEGFQNIDFNSPTFDDDISKLDKNKPVILYCHSGGRSAKCAKKLQEAGFVKIYDLDGGISKWKHEGHEVVVDF
ncbi:rhodanese-like domain-containing protein [Mangrovimonas aestuarii]|uniref:rhodanese-like domain-containing protein n=1 Tax=Mangrovimonas aestuarii TaxID=3018443 RepID=UPI0023785B55|nr:rhodanese-like domain-containing protein [Mangrovimonas aestuarii]